MDFKINNSKIMVYLLNCTITNETSVLLNGLEGLFVES